MKKEGFAVTFEYILVKNLNSKKEDAEKLARLAKKIDCKINLIPYNPSRHLDWEAPDTLEIAEFRRILEERGVFSTLRKSRGRDIQASCGQLRADWRGRSK